MWRWTYTRYSRVADEKKVLGGDCLFKLSKGRDLIKEFGKPWFTLSFFAHAELFTKCSIVDGFKAFKAWTELLSFESQLQ